MKTFRAFLKKEFLHIFRDRRTLLILFGMPLAQVLIFGYAVTNEFKNAHIDVLDHAHNATSAALVAHVVSGGQFQVRQHIATEQEMEGGFKSGGTKMVLVIPKDFDADLYSGKQSELQLIADGSDPNNSVMLVQYATQMIQSFQKERLQLKDNPFQVKVETRMLYNPQLVSAYNFIPGTIALILLIISAMLTSLAIAKEKEMGTMEILLVSPLSPITIILGKVAPYAILSFLNAVMVLLLGYFVFHVPVVGSVVLLLVCCLLYVITALTLGTLISAIVATQQAAMMMSIMVLMLPSMLLSGFIFPVSSMPLLLQGVSRIIPATYFIQILKGVMLRGVGLEVVWVPVVVLIGMTLFLLAMTRRNFSIRLE